MTMPHERMRSLRWGWELQQALHKDLSLLASLVARAEALAQTYPTPQTLVQMPQAQATPVVEGGR